MKNNNNLQTYCQMLLVIMALPYLVKSAVPHVDPSHVILLGSRLCRSSNSPGQLIVSASKRTLQSFAGSLFFERRNDGIKVALINPGPEKFEAVDLATALLFPLNVGPTTCVETVDLGTVNPSKSIPQPVCCCSA